MEQVANPGCAVDDDEDLEQLRLAALKSLKKPLGAYTEKSVHVPPQKPFYSSKNGLNSRGGRGNFHGRAHRNGQFNHRTRNTNLIAVPLISTDTEENTTTTAAPAVAAATTNNSSSKLILPQDRYCKSNTTSDAKSAEQNSKFNRYNDRSDSESESDDDDDDEVEGAGGVVGEKEEVVVVGEDKKLERSNSLEALMQELENEIEGKSSGGGGGGNEESKVKVKVKKVKRKVEEATVVAEEKQPQKKVVTEEKQPQKKVVTQEKQPQKKVVTEEKQPPKKVMLEEKFEKSKKVVAPPVAVAAPLPVQQPYVAAPPVQPPYYQPPVMPSYNPLPPIVPVVHYEPPIRYERHPSPLTIDADLLNTTVTAPLSPRSAAFVMQNREIIERRKQRRSYSRSPSPRYRRSRTKSRSPKSLRGANTPPSPPLPLPPPSRRRVSTPEKKSSVYERLGARIDKSDSPSKRKRSRSKSPKLDPVLEARKKKFESNELKIKEGVIRLKPKSEQEEVAPPATTTTTSAAPVASSAEEEPDDVIDVNVDDLFSDEETDNENEGRFKSSSSSTSCSTTNKESPQQKQKKQQQQSSGAVPFQRLTNKENEKHRRRLMKRAQLSRMMVRTDKQKIAPPVSTLPEKKIEIKIRNPTKYEEKKEVKEQVKGGGGGGGAAATAAASVRKVEIGPRIQRVESGEIVEENEDGIDVDDDEEEVVDLNEGDLRAQLSRKRAERQSKHSVDETVASRLLQSALDSAVFKKAKQSKQKTTSSTTRDGKLPIHSRLGLTTQQQQQPVKKKRKRNKRSNGGGCGGLEQV